jgi:hypothetical protein
MKLNGSSYGDWEKWVEEAFPEEEPKMDRLKTSNFTYLREQDRLDKRRSKGTKAIPTRPETTPEVDITLAAHPEAREVVDDVLMDDMQSMAESQ